MILKKIFKTLNGAQKRAAFENAHCGGKYHYNVIRFVGDKPDTEHVHVFNWHKYHWRLERTTKTTT